MKQSRCRRSMTVTDSAMLLTSALRLTCKARLATTFILMNGWILGGDITLAKDTRLENKTMVQSVSFQTLAHLRGKTYLAEREKVLQNQSGLGNSIQAYVFDDNWQLRIQAP